MPKSLCKVKTSEIHGRGLYATVDIDEETQIIQYVGEKITKKESKKRALAWEEEARKTGEGLVYIFELDDKYDIDGRLGDNPARYMNHSCDGNCEAINFDGEIWIVKLVVEAGMASSNNEARRTVQAGGVKIDDVRVDDADAKVKVSDGMILRVGKRKFRKLCLA